MLTPLILSGGSGTRLWPLSRELYPKQLLPLVGDKTMLQETAARVSGLPDLASPIVVCNESHRFVVAEQMQESGTKPQAIILEPVGRNTAPAVAVAALVALDRARKGKGGNEADPVLLVLPADHVIRDVQAFQSAVAAGRTAAEAGQLVTFGVVPDRAETGYGYIRRAKGDGPAYAVQQFVEKPDAATAQTYVESGEYYWNSGMFMFRARVYLAELKLHAPAMLSACEDAVAAATRDLDFTRLPAEEFGACPSDSIDYAVMEKTDSAVVVPLDAGWSDVGSWSALQDALPRDDAGNVVTGDVLVEDSSGCYLHSTSRLIGAVGLKDHVVVETKDAVLVAPRDRVQDVKALVTHLKAQGRYETALHREVFRPWGSYDSIDHGDRFQVKRLVVKPGATMSLQLHHHRAEHWIVVSGTAQITRGEETFLLGENESTYIPVGTKHRIANPGKVTLHIIEVQSGSYLGEDDIVRFEDVYGREGTTK
ncbi:MAG: mannose-1-phosphate guanylyltransferase/mannose-6-phosphate isomerase [Gammaproteobacteria bacterium]|nr:mannose-1-phosphate guanylyltransferase/mannose-6-phosphate isomerase [Gammaproteobacteria bacterium]MDH4256434.1 mannose-1-phosphate guanylyltransferase/mannose-6-phosphate isomerase [Gammaproteobacteria bacterium]MDH5274277.1 mannose-1-phosphate guanylyltransferase/mannose-6-phosphate isomerase [Gammaproteobacteria bacterium]